MKKKEKFGKRWRKASLKRKLWVVLVMALCFVLVFGSVALLVYWSYEAFVEGILFDALLLVLLLAGLVLFHEVGHRFVIGNKFVEFRNASFKGIWFGWQTVVWKQKITLFEYLNCLMTGFAFSLPFPIIAILFLGFDSFFFLLTIALAAAAIDFVVFFVLLFVVACKYRGRFPLHTKLEDIEEWPKGLGRIE